MIKQIMNGKLVNTTMVSGSVADLNTLAALMDGEVVLYSKGTEGGTPSAITALNFQKFSVGKINIDGSRYSCGVQIPHLKKTKSLADVKAHVIGAWDASLNTTIKCTYCNGIGNSSKA